ncbi:MAG: S6 modification enzyme RimK [Clostridium sp.]
MRELTTQTGIVVKCSKTAIEFSKMLSQWISFCAGDPRGIQGIAVEFYDLIMENDHLAALLGCRGNYDIAIQIDEVTGTMTGWHWFK